MEHDRQERPRQDPLCPSAVPRRPLPRPHSSHLQRRSCHHLHRPRKNRQVRRLSSTRRHARAATVADNAPVMLATKPAARGAPARPATLPVSRNEQSKPPSGVSGAWSWAPKYCPWPPRGPQQPLEQQQLTCSCCGPICGRTTPCSRSRSTRSTVGARQGRRCRPPATPTCLPAPS